MREPRVFGRRVGVGLVTWYVAKDLAYGLGTLLPGGLPVAIMYGMTSSVTWLAREASRVAADLDPGWAIATDGEP